MFPHHTSRPLNWSFTVLVMKVAKIWFSFYCVTLFWWSWRCDKRQQINHLLPSQSVNWKNPSLSITVVLYSHWEPSSSCTPHLCTCCWYRQHGGIPAHTTHQMFMTPRCVCVLDHMCDFCFWFDVSLRVYLFKCVNMCVDGVCFRTMPDAPPHLPPSG